MKMAAERGSLYYMFRGPLSVLSGSATGVDRSIDLLLLILQIIYFIVLAFKRNKVIQT